MLTLLADELVGTLDRIADLLDGERFNPDQPRIPKGLPGAGRWTTVEALAKLLASLGEVAEDAIPAKPQKSKPKKLRGKAVIKATYERFDEPTGLRTVVTGIDTDQEMYSYFQGWTVVYLGIEDADGMDAGSAIFRISPDGKTVHHSEMELEEDFQGQGFATRQMLHVLDSYRELGVERMTHRANSDVGGYAWARTGFEFETPGARATIAANFETHAKYTHRYSEDVRAEMRRVARNPHASPIDFAMVGHQSGMTTWPGKEIMLRSAWDAVMEL